MSIVPHGFSNCTYIPFLIFHLGLISNFLSLFLSSMYLDLLFPSSLLTLFWSVSILLPGVSSYGEALSWKGNTAGRFWEFTGSRLFPSELMWDSFHSPTSEWAKLFQFCRQIGLEVPRKGKTSHSFLNIREVILGSQPFSGPCLNSHFVIYSRPALLAQAHFLQNFLESVGMTKKYKNLSS